MTSAISSLINLQIECNSNKNLQDNFRKLNGVILKSSGISTRESLLLKEEESKESLTLKILSEHIRRAEQHCMAHILKNHRVRKPLS